MPSKQRCSNYENKIQFFMFCCYDNKVVTSGGLRCMMKRGGAPTMVQTIIS